MHGGPRNRSVLSGPDSLCYAYGSVMDQDLRRALFRGLPIGTTLWTSSRNEEEWKKHSNALTIEVEAPALNQRMLFNACGKPSGHKSGTCLAVVP